MPGFVLEAFARMAGARPTAIAIEGASRSISYGDLHELTDRWASVLRARGITAEHLVGVCAPVSVDTVCAVIAVLKAGAAYVPIDPSYPAERIAAIVASARPALVIVRDSLRDWQPLATAPRLPMHELATAGASAARAEPPSLELANLAYAVFTSGSTGKPKGVLVQHAGLRDMIDQQIDTFGITASSRMLQFASFGFDASVSELFTALCAGATLCLIEHAADRQGAAVLDLIERRHVTVATLPPSLLRALPRRELPELATLVSAGEACSAEVVERWRRPGRRIINAYGPSEATVCTTMRSLDAPADATRLGRTLRGLRTYVLRDDLSAVSPGEVGELYIAGHGLARGYLGRAVTAERFVPDPFARGERMYRTGDRVRALADDLEFIGRTDHQVKVRGFRIEPAEVEAALRGAPGVRDAMVAPRRRASGDAVLVAYVLADRAIESSLRIHARRSLAEFMQPAEYVFVDQWPRTPAGKVDLEALAARGRTAVAAAATGTSTQAVLLRLYEDLLELHPIDPDASFFELGGDSILALRLLLRIEAELGRRIGFAALFEAPSAAALARAIDHPADPSAICRGLLLRPGTGAPMWWVPPVHGNPLCYLELARRSPPGRPLYAVQIPGLGDDRPAVDDMVALARTSVEQIREIQPHGPYTIGGWSIGGVLALEISIQLQAAGEHVDGLVLIAATPPSREHVTVARQIMGDYPSWKMGFMYASQMAYSTGQSIDADAEFRAFRELPEDAAGQMLANRLARFGIVSADAPVGEIRRWLRVFRATMHAFHYYDSVAKYRGRVLALSSTQPNPIHTGPIVDRPLPWGDWRAHLEAFDTIKVDGNPLNLLAYPWVDGVIDAVAAWLARA